jgi:hypothetical protein
MTGYSTRMKRKEEARRKRKKRQPPVRIPLPFNQAMKGLLALSPEDAKAAREAANKAKD